MLMYNDSHAITQASKYTNESMTMNNMITDEPEDVMHYIKDAAQLADVLSAAYGYENADFTITRHYQTLRQTLAINSLISMWLDTHKAEAEKLNQAICFKAVQHCLESKLYFSEYYDRFFDKLAGLFHYLYHHADQRLMSKLAKEIQLR